MSNATLCIRAHFDGKFIVPDEPVDLPINAPLNIEVRASDPSASPGQGEIRRKLAALESFANRAVGGTSIPAEMLRREHMYGDDGR